VEVITSYFSNEYLPSNVKVHQVEWEPGKNTKNAVRFLGVLLRVFKQSKVRKIFSHMSPRHTLLTLPLSIPFRIPNFLWYAHKSNNFSLKVCSFFVDKIITSTFGSLPKTIKRKKIICIGQGINSKLFPCISRDLGSRNNLVHIGRNDFAKQLNLIIDVIKGLRFRHPKLHLLLVGRGVSNLEQELHFDWLQLRDAVSRKSLSSILKECDAFVHAYQGSLDKTLIEAAFSKLPIITLNEEFASEFELFDNSKPLNLVKQLESYLTASDASIQKIIDLNYKKALDFHEYSNWILRLVRALSTR